MKQLFATIILMLGTILCQASVYTVNNNNPSPGQYTTLTSAQTAASSGDTLLVSGSLTSYGNLSISKPLTIIGTGHHPVGNFPNASILGDIDFSGSSSSVHDVNLIGLIVNSITFDVSNTKHMYVGRCKIDSYVGFSTDQDSIVLEGNLFASTGNNLIWPTSLSLTENDITIKNNVFNGVWNGLSPSSGGNNLIASNNVFLVYAYLFYNSCSDWTFRNNIFYRADPNNVVTNSYFENNIIYHAYGSNTTFPTTNGNTSSGNMATDPKFTNFPSTGGYYSYSYDFTLQSTSPAINAGTDGKDIGLTGGNGYFQRYGIPNVPQVNQFSITSPTNATVVPGGTLQISVMSTIAR
ncbi:MAG: hypothetical protein JST27_01595 [Bacteroidetes bacterium]|nr:hypothetical protein [Bacteroidota bacterium]